MREIKVVGPNAAKMSASLNLREWLKQFDSNLLVDKIFEQWSCFSPTGEVVYAIFLIAGRFVFFRRDAVAVFIAVKDKETVKKYIVLVEQVRIPAGGKLLEIPAGTIEDGGDPLKTAVREVKEEVGLNIPAESFNHMGTYYPSPGACNEKIFFFYCGVDLSSQEIKYMQGRFAGLHEEGESTQVKLVPFEEFKNIAIKDAKTQLAYELYRKVLLK